MQVKEMELFACGVMERLVQSILQDIRVHIYFNNVWGNICNDSSFGDTEADVICHQLGYTGASSHTEPDEDKLQ